MFHTLAWTESIAITVENDILPVPDGIIEVSNNHFRFGRDMFLLWAAAMSTTISRARFISPSLRQVTNPHIRPLITGVVPENDPGVLDLRDNPLRLRALEELQVMVTQLGAGAEQVSVIAALGDRQIVRAAQGDIFKLRGTSSSVAVAQTWSLLAMLWDDTLPAGKYDVVGLEHQSANGKAARITLEEQWMRPGALSITGVRNRNHALMRDGGMGVMGSFDANRMPNVEVFCNAGDAVHEVYLDIIRRI